MTDRELLEAAAKAAGIEWTRHNGKHEGMPGLVIGATADWSGLNSAVWNPLIDDGDAFRLAVKCRITDLALAVGEYVGSGEYIRSYDVDAITRRAIVRAAAAMANQEAE